MLEASGARLEHARAMADLGAALRRAGQPPEAANPPASRSTSPTAAVRPR